MFDRYFVHPSYLAAALLVAAPILIHLINRFRFARVRWAAFDFLLESERRNRRRILFEQWLLLALRCALVLGAVAIVSRPLVGDALSALLASDQQTEHVILFDDSYSMGQQQGTSTAFERGRAALARLVSALANHPGDHRLTVLRTSSRSTPELEALRVDRPLAGRFAVLCERWRPTHDTAGLAAALADVEKRITAIDVARRVLYVISDFRVRDWRGESDAIAALRRLAADGVDVRLIDAVDETGHNLGIEAIATRHHTVAAGVPFVVTATVHNRSNRDVENVHLKVEVDGKPLPAPVLERVPAGGSATVAFDARLDEIGLHSISAATPSDVLAADNRRFLAVTVVETVPVLLIDGAPERGDARFLSLALAPGGEARTGIDPVIAGPASNLVEEIERFRAIFLMNVARIDESLAERLARYVETGGGVAIFLGDQIRATDYNALRGCDGAPLLPVRLASVRDLSGTPRADGPDWTLQRHPIFRIFEGQRNPFVKAVRIEKFFAVTPQEKGRPATVIARYRDGSPLAIETRIGAGRLLLFLTSAGPAWNSWRNPSFVVAMLELQAYLGEQAPLEDGHRVGTPWEFRFAAAEFRREVTVVRPANSDAESEIDAVQAEDAGSDYRIAYRRTDRPGVYLMTRRRIDGVGESRARAFNVDPEEGDLARLGPNEWADRLAGKPYRYHDARDFEAEIESRGFGARDLLLLAFVAVLFLEQCMAYRLGYHRH